MNFGRFNARVHEGIQEGLATLLATGKSIPLKVRVLWPLRSNLPGPLDITMVEEFGGIHRSFPGWGSLGFKLFAALESRLESNAGLTLLPLPPTISQAVAGRLDLYGLYSLYVFYF